MGIGVITLSEEAPNVTWIINMQCLGCFHRCPSFPSAFPSSY